MLKKILITIALLAPLFAQPVLADTKEDDLAKEQGKAFDKALQFVFGQTQHKQKQVDDYVVTLLTQKANGWYVDPRHGLTWRSPTRSENAHVEVVVQDKKDLRFIPDLKVRAFLTDERGRRTNEQTLPFIWHPVMHHYGTNWHVARRGNYWATITVEKPTFDRHDKDKGNRYTRRVTLILGPVMIEPGHNPKQR